MVHSDGRHEGHKPRSLSRWNPVFVSGFVWGWMRTTYFIGLNAGVNARAMAEQQHMARMQLAAQRAAEVRDPAAEACAPATGPAPVFWVRPNLRPEDIN